MKLSTIWTMPAMSLKERFRRTADWVDFTIAAHLPKRIQYWTVIHVGAKATTGPLAESVVPEVLFMDVLKVAEGSPRA